MILTPSQCSPLLHVPRADAFLWELPSLQALSEIKRGLGIVSIDFVFPFRLSPFKAFCFA